MPLSPFWYKINFDTAIRDSFLAETVVCSNHKGHIIRMISEISAPCFPNYGEALAAQLAVTLATSLKLGRFIIEGELQGTSLALQQPSISQDWRISPILHDIINSISAFFSWEVRKVNRSVNFCAQYVAHWAATRSMSGSIPIAPPHLLPLSKLLVEKIHLPMLF